MSLSKIPKESNQQILQLDRYNYYNSDYTLLILTNLWKRFREEKELEKTKVKIVIEC